MLDDPTQPRDTRTVECIITIANSKPAPEPLRIGQRVRVTVP
jgi:hypothetical protein